ncbi:MAG: hypothetical protein AUH31_09620 [Armatimonadetes bacterium 13_1_40CM_64_14]|nr:MAG: hypothetical protein AUH31_09620 [Armatimonadetes bacterium 13_1_40CM_64_14]
MPDQKPLRLLLPTVLDSPGPSSIHPVIPMRRESGSRWRELPGLSGGTHSVPAVTVVGCCSQASGVRPVVTSAYHTNDVRLQGRFFERDLAVGAEPMQGKGECGY